MSVCMNQKIENLLYISLNISEEEREQSENLNVGYNDLTNKWQVIVRADGNLSYLEEKYPGTKVFSLLENYAIVETSQVYVEDIATESSIWYMEKPKNFYYGLELSKEASCIYSGMISPAGTFASNDMVGSRSIASRTLTGRGVLVAIIDSGIDLLEPEFLHADGTSRVAFLWNQENDMVYDQIEINQAVRQKIQLASDDTGHGTNVALIACGNHGVAPRAFLVVVKLARSRNGRGGFPRTVEIMRALDYVIRLAKDMNLPVAINLSIGNNYGSHQGNSLLETYMDAVSNVGRNVMCVGTGNEATAGIHFAGNVLRDGNNGSHLPSSKQILIELSVGEAESAWNLQLWKNPSDIMEVALLTPSGQRIGPVRIENQVQQFVLENMRIVAFVGEPSPYSVLQEIYFDVFAENDGTFVQSGIWTIEITPIQITNGQYDIWLPSSVILNNNTRFIVSDANLTQTIPSTARRVVSVGAYDAGTDAYASFSGRGGTVRKPDVVAPGVDILLKEGMTGERVVSGTSFATPFVTGMSACLMEWGITLGNDPYLYGEKIKASLIAGARKLPRYVTWPNSQVGWGAVCLENILAKWYS